MHISSIETSFLDYPNETTMIVFMSGCALRCPNCHNPALQSPSVGEDITLTGLEHELIKRPLCRSITFSGGDPLFQEEVLIKYCKELCKHVKIGVYTGKSIDEVPSELLQYISFLKTEPYVEKLGGVQEQTTNQKCWDVVDGKAVENKEYFKVK
jgi:anaerobic ribonucleoside-triphosphate reductase activating protein